MIPVLQAWVAAAWFHDIIRQVDEQLGQAPLSCGVVTKNRGKGGVAQRFRKALPKGFAGAGIVTEAIRRLATLDYSRYESANWSIIADIGCI